MASTSILITGRVNLYTQRLCPQRFGVFWRLFCSLVFIVDLIAIFDIEPEEIL
jgi:hypothetical protein